jgi:TPR repeat protein
MNNHEPSAEGVSQQTNSAAYDTALAEMQSDAANTTKATALLCEAHAAGDPRAAYALGTWYLRGLPPTITKDTPRAVTLIKEAAEAGVADALYDLAVLYETGEGVDQDEMLAFRNYLSAALRGEQQSIYEVGRCYEHGIGVERDREIAAIWRQRATELGIT